MRWWRIFKVKRCLIVYGIVTMVTLIYLLMQTEKLTEKTEKRKEKMQRTSSAIYTRIPSSNIYIFSVIGINTTDKYSWDIFAVNIWIFQSVTSTRFWCCFLHENGSVEINDKVGINQRQEMFNQTAQIECKNPNSPTSKLIVGVTLSADGKCTLESTAYVKPEFSKKFNKEFSMAICAKIAYGDLNTPLTIEWMEYYKAMGVDHVLAYTYNLSQQAYSVLKYYENTRFLELRKFDFPNQDTPEQFVGAKSSAAWNDEQVVVYDCQARLSGYKYVAVLDFDEFLVPLMDRSFERMIKRLMHLIPNTGAIDFFGEIFVTDWGPTNSDGELHVMRYRNRTTSRKPIEINQRKVIHLPARIQRGSVVTHGCKVKEEYTILKDPTAILGMNHYRQCVDFWEDCLTRTRTTDHRIIRPIEGIKSKVVQVKSKLLH